MSQSLHSKHADISNSFIFWQFTKQDLGSLCFFMFLILFTGAAWSKGRSNLDHCLLIGWTYKWPIHSGSSSTVLILIFETSPTWPNWRKSQDVKDNCRKFSWLFLQVGQVGCFSSLFLDMGGSCLISSGNIGYSILSSCNMFTARLQEHVMEKGGTEMPCGIIMPIAKAISQSHMKPQPSRNWPWKMHESTWNFMVKSMDFHVSPCRIIDVHGFRSKCHEMSFNLTWWHLMTNGYIWPYSVILYDIWWHLG